VSHAVANQILVKASDRLDPAKMGNQAVLPSGGIVATRNKKRWKPRGFECDSALQKEDK